MKQNGLNSGNTQTGNAVGNPDRSSTVFRGERATTIPKGSTPKRVEKGRTLVQGDDIVSTVLKDTAVILCKRCGEPKVFLDGFYVSNKRVCKVCIGEKVSAYQKTTNGRAVHIKALSRWNGTLSAMEKKHTYKLSDKGKASERRYAKSMRVKKDARLRARGLVNTHISRGKLIRPSFCECGFIGFVQAHHDDYTKPLEVRWLCVSCHKIADAK